MRLPLFLVLATIALAVGFYMWPALDAASDTAAEQVREHAEKGVKVDVSHRGKSKRERKVVALLPTAPELERRGADRTVLPMGTMLYRWRDEISGDESCAIFGPMRGVQAGLYEDGTVILWAYERFAIDPVPTLWLGEQRLPLKKGEKPGLLLAPASHYPRIVQSLYERQKMQARLYSPGLEEKTFEVEAGDFAGAYDQAISKCGWRALGLRRPELPRGPEIHRGDKGYISATFGGYPGWVVTIMPEFQTCDMRSPQSQLWFSLRKGRREADSWIYADEAIIRDFAGREIARIEHRDHRPAPLGQLLRAARTAGERGTIEMFLERQPLFGLSEAVAFATKHCSLRVD